MAAVLVEKYFPRNSVKVPEYFTAKVMDWSCPITSRLSDFPLPIYRAMVE